jgi:hypothetical protein
VSLALDEELHREVALKEVQERYGGDDQPRMRFSPAHGEAPAIDSPA